ncbi:hypothetical protein C1I95_17645 [Micromonospora craterilacus]|uniref:Uncharacterized protein n=1 Tax=Micromonospora craterilacus TaxID=1655439 RepID=A0A2W2EI60_9ACTN|nr:hypothetical protein [Micromonospora craterilacus]PZG16495.1 hypothetical protein C1I95_17645 [Micromonospora craterilacus]
MNGTITQPGAVQRRTYGNFEVALNLTVELAFNIAVSAAGSPHRYDELSFTTPDADTANLIHRVIRDGALQGVRAEGIREAVDQALRAELFEVQARHDTPSQRRAEHINALLDQMESLVDDAAIAELVESMRAGEPYRSY